LDLDDKNVTRLRGLNVERPGQVVNFGQVDVLDVVCRFIIANLAAGPVEAFDLDDLTVGDGADARD